MRLRQAFGLGSLIAALMAGAVQAQDPVAAAEQQYRRDVVGATEEFLFNTTGKTTSVTYLKMFREGEAYRFCGEARFGSVRQSFIIDQQALTRPPSRAAWARAGCDSSAGKVIIDVR